MDRYGVAFTAGTRAVFILLLERGIVHTGVTGDNEKTGLKVGNMCVILYRYGESRSYGR